MGPIKVHNGEIMLINNIQNFDSHVKFFLIVVGFQLSSASCLFLLYDDCTLF